MGAGMAAAAERGAPHFQQTVTVSKLFAPQRGLYHKLSPREVLLTLTGPSELKRPEDGLPFPVLLRLHRSSTRPRCSTAR